MFIVLYSSLLQFISLYMYSVYEEARLIVLSYRLYGGLVPVALPLVTKPTVNVNRDRRQALAYYRRPRGSVRSRMTDDRDQLTGRAGRRSAD